MKALSLTQPWATLIAIGAKRIETRSWSTTHRATIAIHAAKGFPRDVQEMCVTEPFLSALKGDGVTNTKELPTGAIVAVATLLGCRFTDDVVNQIAEQEREFGDYSPGRYAWMLADVRRLQKPIPCKGALGLWTVPADIVEALKEIA